MNIDKNDTAVVFIDPQNEVLSDKGLAWKAVGESIRENKTVENMERIFKAAKQNGFEVFISPHYFFPTDDGWKFNGPLETDEAQTKMFARKGRLNLDGSLGQVPTGSSVLSRTSKTARLLWSVRTGYLVRRRTISSCSSANAASARSFSVGCWRTCVLNRTCGTCSNRASKSSSQRTRRRRRGTPNGATVTRRR